MTAKVRATGLAVAGEIISGKAIWKKRAPPKYVVDGLLPAGKLAMICAYGSSLKTWLLLSLALSVASGTKWLGLFACKKRRALVLDFENDEAETTRRIRGLSPRLHNFDLCIMPSVLLTAKNAEHVVMALASEYGLIAIDSLAAGSVGVSENDARFAEGLRMLKRVAAKTGCVVVILHHTRKTRTDKEGAPIEEADARQMPRGTGAIYAACDVVIMSESTGEHSARVSQSKARQGRSIEPFTVTLTGDAPATVKLTAVSESARREAAARAKLKMISAKYLGVLRKGPPEGLSANELVRLVGGNKQAGLECVRMLSNAGLIVRVDGRYRAPASGSKIGSSSFVMA